MYMFIDGKEIITFYKEIIDNDINQSLHQLIINHNKDENIKLEQNKLKDIFLRISINKDKNVVTKDIKLEISNEI